MALSSSSSAPVGVDFHAWIESVRPTLAPPVGNKLLYGAGQHKVMIVGGPNAREDFHLESGEEIFLQLVGDMELPIMLHGKRVVVPIREGELFLLPRRIPHSPQRKAGTVGFVMERERKPDEIDGLRWYTRDGSGRILYEEFFHCTDLGVQLKPVIERFFAMECYRTGVPDRTFSPAPIDVDDARDIVWPFSLEAWVAERATAAPDATQFILCGPGCSNPLLSDFEYTVTVHTGAGADAAGYSAAAESEIFVYQRRGASRVYVRPVGDPTAETCIALAEGHVTLIPGHATWEVRAEWGAGLALIVTNAVNAAPRSS